MNPAQQFGNSISHFADARSIVTINRSIREHHVDAQRHESDPQEVSMHCLQHQTSWDEPPRQSQLRQLLFVAITKHVIEPLKSSSVIMRFIARRDQRMTVTLQLSEVGKSYTYARRRHLSGGSRVDSLRWLRN